MGSEMIYGLLPDHLVLGAVLVLMLLETVRLDPRWSRLAFLGALLASGGVLLLQLHTDYAATIAANELQIDRLAILGKLVVLGCGLGLGLGFSGVPGPQPGYKFWLLAASALFGAMVILDSAGFVSLFIGIEMLSLPAFALMVHNHGHSAAGEGAFKYLLLSSVATAVLLFGISLAYGVTGDLSIASFAHALPGAGAQVKAAGLLVLCGLFLKAAVFPFHAWAPDAYAAARLPVTAMMASLTKAAVILALLRIVGTMALDESTSTLIAMLAIVSIVYGNLAALGQLHFKRMLAYSSIAHAGYMVFALVDTTGSRIDDLFWYTGLYAAFVLLACASFAALCPDEDDDMSALDGRFAQQPVAALLLALSVLSLAGLPPFPGFFAKLFVFKSVVASGHLAAAVLAFIGSFLGLAYYLGIVVRLFKPDARRSVVTST